MFGVALVQIFTPNMNCMPSKICFHYLIHKYIVVKLTKIYPFIIVDDCFKVQENPIRKTGSFSGPEPEII